MPAIGSKLVLNSAAQSSNVVLADINLIGGATYGVPSFSDLEDISSEYVQNGQIMFVADEALFYSATVTVGGPPSFATTLSWDEVSLGQADTSSFLTSADTGSFLTSADTSSMSVATASFISDTFISASAVRSGFGAGGGGSIPDGTISGSQQITDFGFVSSSVDTSLFVLVSETGSFLTAEDTGSFLTSADTSSFVLISNTSSMSVATASFISDTFISASAARSGFGAGGGGSIPDGTVSGSQQITDLGFVSSSTDISSLNTFTASIQTEVNSLTNATSSYLTSVPSGTISGSQQVTDLGFITSVPSGTISGSQQVTDLGFITSVPSGTVSGSTQITNVIDDTYISASAASSGFGAGGGGGIFTQVGSDYETTNNLRITGSLSVGDGLLKFKEYSSLPSVEPGSIAYYAGEFYLGQDS
jgi:hypothetical protein